MPINGTVGTASAGFGVLVLFGMVAVLVGIVTIVRCNGMRVPPSVPDKGKTELSYFIDLR